MNEKDFEEWEDEEWEDEVEDLTEALNNASEPLAEIDDYVDFDEYHEKFAEFNPFEEVFEDDNRDPFRGKRGY
jgi:hypothetical protein